jgi:hypothetical protein
VDDKNGGSRDQLATIKQSTAHALAVARLEPEPESWTPAPAPPSGRRPIKTGSMCPTATGSPATSTVMQFRVILGEPDAASDVRAEGTLVGGSCSPAVWRSGSSDLGARGLWARSLGFTPGSCSGRRCFSSSAVVAPGFRVIK